MPKGESKKTQRMTDYQTGLEQNQLNNLQTQQITPQYQNSYNDWRSGVGQNVGDYGQQQQQYNNFLNPQQSQSQSGGMGNVDGSPEQIAQYLQSKGGDPKEAAYWASKWPELQARGKEIGDPNYAMMRLSKADSLPGGGQYGAGGVQSPNSIFQQGMNGALQGYGEFAQSGGFSPQDIQNMRARAIAPIRGMYQQGQNELARAKNLSGGYMPNFAAAQNKMMRNQSNAMSDTGVNTEAAIAQLRNQGRLAGMGGLSNIGQVGMQGQLQGLQGQTSLYGASPGLASTFGNQMLGSGNQLIDLQKLQQGIGDQAINSRIAQMKQPSAWTTGSNAYKNIMQGTYGV